MAKSTHTSHPKCPKCGKALYKAKDKGKQVKKEDPWAYCRNVKCELYGVDQSLSESTPLLQIPQVVEPEFVHQARQNIKRMYSLDDSSHRNAIYLALVILAQELGHQQIANQLIDKYCLTEQFGILKRI
jgi:hypothetical protein